MGSGTGASLHSQALDDVLKGHINPGRVFDFKTDLNGIAEAYAAMDERRGRLSHL